MRYTTQIALQSLSLFLLFVNLAYGQVTLYSEDFTGQNGKGAIGPGTTNMGGVTNWAYTPDFTGMTATTDWFQVVSEQMEARDVDIEQVWESTTFSIFGYSTITITMDMFEVGDHELDDYIAVYYVLDGGAETLIISQADDFTSHNLNFTGITGSTLKLVVKVYNNAGTEYIQFDNVLVTGDNSSSAEVTNAQGVPSDQVINFSWSNPGGCLDEVMIVGSATGSVTTAPTGDGTAYSANSTFGSGTDIGSGEYDVYEGLGNSVTVSGLTNGTTYCFTIFTRCGTDWSTGTEICLTPWDYRDTLTICAYNVLNYPGSTGARSTSFATIMHWLNPDIILANEMVSAAGASTLLNSSLNIWGVSTWAQATFVNGPDSDNQLYYNSNKVMLSSQNAIATTLRDINHYEVSWSDVNGGTNNLHLFSFHLKAGNSAIDEDRRADECKDFRNWCDANIPAAENVILGGDFNFYGAGTEPGWDTLVNSVVGVHDFHDPIDQVGNWHDNAVYSAIHTQSTRSITNPGGSGGSTGGMDDRFDFLLINDAVLNGTDGVRYLPNSYDNIGNDGNKYNFAIIENLPNTDVPDTVRDALFDMSDHLPVILQVAFDPNIIVLPVELSGFTAEKQGEIVALNWYTLSEKESSHFVVERSADGINFHPLFNVSSQGNSNTYIPYEDWDNDPLMGVSYYRLKMVDKNNDFAYSAVRRVIFDAISDEISLYPNPSSSFFELNSKYGSAEDRFIQILSSSGQVIDEFVWEEDLASKRIDISSLSEGVYMVQVNGSETRTIKKLVVRR
jgi:hypothetical protein